MGSFDQCLHVPWLDGEQHRNIAFRTQYCLVDVKSAAVEKSSSLEPFDSADEYFRVPIKDTLSFKEQAFGVCLPASCSPSSVVRISRHMHQLTHLPDGEVSVDHRDCRTAGEVVAYPWGFYAFWSLIGLLLATAVYSTLSNHEETKQSLLGTMTKSFCMRRNYNSLFKVNSDEIQVMNGMRVITAALIVVVHEAFYSILCPSVNGLEIEKIMHSSLGLSLSHLEIVVDTFFAMSALLLVRGLMLGKQKNVLYTLVKRYIRLIGPIVICLFYITTVSEYVDNGPFWSRSNRYEDVCKKYWWKTILMANTDTETLCHVVSWYVSSDFQLTILATLLFYLYSKNKRLGVFAFIAVSSGLTFNVGWMVYRHKLEILPFGLKAILQLRNNKALNYTYLKSYSRAGPYLVGMVMGYFLTTHKPIDHRNIISKKWSIIATIVSGVTMLTMLCVGTIFSGRPYNPLVAAVVVATNRVFWALGVCCIIGVCEYGTLPIVSKILSWRGFVPLSKLSYGLYLLHPFIVQKEKYAARNGAVFSIYNANIRAYGVIVAGCVCSLGLYLMLEAPLINISNALFSEKSKTSQRTGIKEDTNDNKLIPNQNGHAKAKIL